MYGIISEKQGGVMQYIANIPFPVQMNVKKYHRVRLLFFVF
jgi:hypothetical protein